MKWPVYVVDDLGESRREQVWERCACCGTEKTLRMLKASIAPRYPERVGWCSRCRAITPHVELTWWDTHNATARTKILGENHDDYQPEWRPSATK